MAHAVEVPPDSTSRARWKLPGLDALFPYLLLAPSLLVIVGLVVYPAIDTAYVSLFQTGPMFPGSTFVGIENYLKIAASQSFRHSLFVTLYFVAASLVITVVLGLGVALILNEEFYGRSIVRAAVILPWAIPEIVNGMMWLWIYDPNSGILNGILEYLGIIDRYVHWLGSPFLALNMLVLADSWKQLPLYILIFLAALQTLPREIYEQAKVDGANSIQSFFAITLPLLRATLLVVLALRTLFAFRTFGIVYVLTGGGPADATKILGYHIYEETFAFLQFGYGAALSVSLTALVALVVLGYFWLLGRRPVQM
jgi:multiple sugar transport system permease protein